jgi:hypothetical protein
MEALRILDDRGGGAAGRRGTSAANDQPKDGGGFGLARSAR